MHRNPSNRPSSLGLLAAGTLALLSWTGCGPSGPELGRVTGTITLDGLPLPNAMILFQPAVGSPSVGMTDKKGRYELDYTPQRQGALVGKHMVQITTWQVVSREDGGEETLPERVPAEYNSESTLAIEVTSGRNVLDFPLLGQSSSETELPESDDPLTTEH